LAEPFPGSVLGWLSASLLEKPLHNKRPLIFPVFGRLALKITSYILIDAAIGD
jgi:hypothetical protein